VQSYWLSLTRTASPPPTRGEGSMRTAHRLLCGRPSRSVSDVLFSASQCI